MKGVRAMNILSKVLEAIESRNYFWVYLWLIYLFIVLPNKKAILEWIQKWQTKIIDKQIPAKVLIPIILVVIGIVFYCVP